MKKIFSVLLFISISINGLTQSSSIQEIDLNDEPFIDFDLLDSNISIYRVFFSGETHLISNNRKLHFYLFKYLYYHANVRYYLIEANYSYAYLFNKYIQTGNESYLEGMAWMSNEYRLFLLKMYEFNKSLPQNEKIEILNSDSEPFVNSTIVKRVLADLIDHSNPIPSEIEKNIELLEQINRDPKDWQGIGFDIRGKDKKPILDVLNVINSSIDSNQKLYRNYFKDNYPNLLLLVRNHATILRGDKNIAKNFIEYILPYYKRGNFFFQYGNLHAQFKGRWLANEINHSKELNGKCVNFLAQYRNCSYSFKNIIYTENNLGILSKGKYEKLLDKIDNDTNGDISLLNINDSPYYNSLKKENIDYLFFIKNQLPEN